MSVWYSINIWSKWDKLPLLNLWEYRASRINHSIKSKIILEKRLLNSSCFSEKIPFSVELKISQTFLKEYWPISWNFLKNVSWIFHVSEKRFRQFSVDQKISQTFVKEYWRISWIFFEKNKLQWSWLRGHVWSAEHPPARWFFLKL